MAQLSPLSASKNNAAMSTVSLSMSPPPSDSPSTFRTSNTSSTVSSGRNKGYQEMTTARLVRDDSLLSRLRCAANKLVMRLSDASYLEDIPLRCVALWEASQESELNRFAKMSAHSTYEPHPSDAFDVSTPIAWDTRIMRDLARAGKLFVCGDNHQIFEFAAARCEREKQQMAWTAVRYLEVVVQQSMSGKLEADAAQAISKKVVRQSLIALCQEFVNEPYFKLVKASCAAHCLQPVDIGVVGWPPSTSVKSWTPRLCLNVHGDRVYAQIVRLFQCYRMRGVEAIETEVYVGFKRTFSIDCLGGPPVILPPTFLAHDRGRHMAYQLAVPKQHVTGCVSVSFAEPESIDFIPNKRDAVVD